MLPLEPSLAVIALLAFAIQVARYLLVAVPAHLLVTSRPRWLSERAIATTPPGREQALRDLGLSFLSMALFGGVAVVVGLLRREGVVSLDASDSTAWTAAVVVLMLIGHDAWFYATHRLLHAKALFPFFHRAHHLSRDPSPLTAFAFHPAEAIVQATYVVLVLVLVPVPRAAIFWFQTVAFLINVYGHLGVELLPARFRHSWWFGVLNTTTHHHQHHRSFTHNYGLYFQWWDRLFGTNHPAYAETFEANAARTSSTEQPVAATR